jgi:hypothetical protein
VGEQDRMRAGNLEVIYLDGDEGEDVFHERSAVAALPVRRRRGSWYRGSVAPTLLLDIETGPELAKLIRPLWIAWIRPQGSLDGSMKSSPLPTQRRSNLCGSIERVDAGQARGIASELDLDLDDIGICLACLSFVSMAIDHGDEREIRGELIRMTPDLWAEGLALPARLALQRARKQGVAGAEAALADIEKRGGRSLVAQAIVYRLAADLSARAKGDPLKMGFQPWPPAELN